jgi:hypothetical protein
MAKYLGNVFCQCGVEMCIIKAIHMQPAPDLNRVAFTWPRVNFSLAGGILGWRCDDSQDIGVGRFRHLASNSQAYYRIIVAHIALSEHAASPWRLYSPTQFWASQSGVEANISSHIFWPIETISTRKQTFRVRLFVWKIKQKNEEWSSSSVLRRKVRKVEWNRLEGRDVWLYCVGNPGPWRTQHMGHNCKTYRSLRLYSLCR